MLYTLYSNSLFLSPPQVSGSIEISNHLSIDDLVAVMPLILGPESKTHAFEEKYLTITNSTYVGYSSQATCHDASDIFEDLYYKRKLLKYSKLGRGLEGSVRAGITPAVFTSGQNSAPTMAFQGLHAYQALRGKNVITSEFMTHFLL